MLICRVIGHVWATKKQEALNGQKLMIVKETETAQGKGDVFVAADMVGAGVGEAMPDLKRTPAQVVRID